MAISELLLLLALASLNEGPAPQDPAPDDGKYHLAVLHVASDSGALYAEGVSAACTAHALADRIEVHDVEYATEREGVLKIRELLGKNYDAILGPTESGTLVAAMAERKEWSDANGVPLNDIPVISPLVTVETPIEEDGWFFVTNLGVSPRAYAVYDYLSKYWIRSITVLYEDTEFGRRAEDAFRKQLNERQGGSYQALPYDINSDDRRELRMVMNSRPEAVGIFGERDYIEVVSRELPRMNITGSDYAPLFFSLIGLYGFELETDIDYVSVVPPSEQEPLAQGATGPAAQSGAKAAREVYALAKDTTAVVLDILAQLEDPPGLTRGQRREHLRDRLALVLSGAASTQTDTHTLRFSSFRNHAPAVVFQRRAGAVSELDLNATVAWTEKVAMKYRLVLGRFGWRPLVYVGLCLAAVLILNFAALYRWEQGRWWWVLLRPRAYALFLGNGLFVLALIIFFAETGAIRYDGLLPMLALALGPTAFLRSAVHAMPAGKAVDVAEWYDRATRWLTEGVVLRERKKRDTRATYLAYYNLLGDMRNEVRAAIRPDHSEERKKRFGVFEKELESQADQLEKKRVCARFLLREYGWRQLKRSGFVPERLDRNAAHPDLIVRRVVQHCMNNEAREKALDELVQQHLPVSDELETEFTEMLKGELNKRGQLWVKARFLYIRFGQTVTPKLLREQDLLSKKAAPWYSPAHW